MALALEKSKLVPKDLGVVKGVLADEYKSKPLAMGRIIGEVSDITVKTDAQGRQYWELRGRFKATPIKPLEIDGKEIPSIVAPRCLLPEKEHNEVVAEKRKPGVSIVQFAFDAEVRQDAKAALKYSWHLTPLFPVSGADSDPLAAVEARIANGKE